jgi:hypothetical protein
MQVVQLWLKLVPAEYWEKKASGHYRGFKPWRNTDNTGLFRKLVLQSFYAVGTVVAKTSSSWILKSAWEEETDELYSGFYPK